MDCPALATMPKLTSTPVSNTDMSDDDITTILRDGQKPKIDPQAASDPKPPTPTPTSSSGVSGAKDLIARIEQAGSASLLDENRKIVVGGWEIRPVSLGSIEMLHLLESKLISGVRVNNVADLLGDCLEFIMLHVISEDDAVEHCFLSKVERQKAVMKWGLKVKVQDIEGLVKSTIGVIASATSTQVKGTPPEHVKAAGRKGSGSKKA